MKFDPQIIAILANTVDIFFRSLSFLVIVRILMSWFAPRANGRIAYFIYSTTQPILAFFRKLPLRIGFLDLSPLIALFALDFARSILLQLIFRIPLQ